MWIARAPRGHVQHQHVHRKGPPSPLKCSNQSSSSLITKAGTVETKIGQVETAFKERTKEPVNLLTAITSTQNQHSADLLNLQQKDKVNQDATQDIQQRLTKLETHPVLLSRANSTTTMEDKQPALIMGGWADDQEASTTLQLANDACAKLQLEIDMQDAFVPGLRRGYLVIPYQPEDHENERAMFSRFTQATQ